MSEPNLGEQTEEFWEDFHKIAGVQAICNLWDKAFNCWVIEDIAQVLIKHGIVSEPNKWVEITDDPATWPSVGSIVWAANKNRKKAVLMFDGFENGRRLWRKATKMKFGDYASNHGPITHWRPI